MIPRARRSVRVSAFTRDIVIFANFRNFCANQADVGENGTKSSFCVWNAGKICRFAIVMKTRNHSHRLLCFVLLVDVRQTQILQFHRQHFPPDSGGSLASHVNSIDKSIYDISLSSQRQFSAHFHPPFRCTS